MACEASFTNHMNDSGKDSSKTSDSDAEANPVNDLIAVQEGELFEVCQESNAAIDADIYQITEEQ